MLMDINEMTKNIPIIGEIERKIKETEKEEKACREKQFDLEMKLNSLSRIEEIVKGFEKTRTRYKEDGARYLSSLYFFVHKITKEDIIANKEFSPSLYANCPKCNESRPVLMEYKETTHYQEYEPYDAWEKKAFTICCDQVNQIKYTSRDHKFLTFI